jgi:gamma-glutamyltranspeptidase/glutathione hydrolase
MLACLTALAVMASCTSTNDAPKRPGAGPIVHSLETDESKSVHGMVATATRESTQIAVAVLEAGGNAIDAAVAASFALGITDPGDSGLGGMAYILIRFSDGHATVIDGSALVPLRIDRTRLAEIQEQGLERGMELAAVPVGLAALDHAISRYGTMPLEDVIQPSVELARKGYYPTPFQEVSIRRYLDDLLASDYLKHRVLVGGKRPPKTTKRQKRPDLADVLERIAAGGAAEFYRGSIAQEIDADMADRGGFVSKDDLGIIRIREVAPLRGTYRGTEVLAIPNPSMAGAVIEALNILEEFPSEALDRDDAGRHQILAEAFHLATVDHEKILSNRSFAANQARLHMLTKEFATERAQLITIGRPTVTDEFPHVQTKKDDDGHTTQISVVDRWGNAVSITQSLGRFFGNKKAASELGFPYNSFLEGQDNLSARAPIPTFMSPSIVVRDGQVLLVLGSASSARIPGVVATVISNIVDRGFDLRQAVLAPRILWSTMQKPGVYAEVFPPITPEQIDQLGSFGYEPIFRVELPVRQSRFARFGAVNAVYVEAESGVMTGVGDPRRNGSALGASRVFDSSSEEISSPV